jgi:hypothetical protein
MVGGNEVGSQEDVVPSGVDPDLYAADATSAFYADKPSGADALGAVLAETRNLTATHGSATTVPGVSLPIVIATVSDSGELNKKYAGLIAAYSNVIAMRPMLELLKALDKVASGNGISTTLEFNKDANGDVDKSKFLFQLCVKDCSTVDQILKQFLRETGCILEPTDLGESSQDVLRVASRRSADCQIDELDVNSGIRERKNVKFLYGLMKFFAEFALSADQLKTLHVGMTEACVDSINLPCGLTLRRKFGGGPQSGTFTIEFAISPLFGRMMH